MISYLDTLNVFYTKLMNFIKNNEGIEPFSSVVSDMIKQEIIKLTSNIQKACEKTKSIEKSYDRSFKIISSEYEKNELILEEKLRIQQKEIEEKYEQRIQLIKEEIAEKIKEVHFEENRILMDIEFFLSANSQNIDIFEREYEDNVSRFNYLSHVASDSYAQNTIQFNDELEREIEKLKQIYDASLSDYDKETDGIIGHYQKNVDNLNAVLASKLEEFSKYVTSTKDQRRQESMELNDKIRSLINEKNQKIQDAKSNYTHKQNEALTDKENKRLEYQMESQKISREFVLSMTELDDHLAELKRKFNTTTDQEKRKLHYKLLELKKQQEKELSIAYGKERPNKLQIHHIHGQYYRHASSAKKYTDKVLKGLNAEFKYDTENANYRKKLLDLDRTYSIKSILENESYMNKQFQEINSEYENEMNISLQIHNLEYNRAANFLRTEATLKNLKDEKDYDENDTLHQIEIEKLSAQIKRVKYEIESFLEIQKLLHQYEENKFKTTSNYKTVYTVLEIEKCKVLDTLNRSMYDLNTKSCQMVLDNNKRSLELKNKEYEHIHRKKIDRNNHILTIEQKEAIYQMECLKRDEDLELNILNRNFFYELDMLGHNFLAEKFSLEYKKIMGYLSVLTNILKQIQFGGIHIASSVFSAINIRPENFNIVWSFMKEYMRLILEHFQAFVNCYQEIVNAAIHERLEFEENLKYKGFQKNIETIYNEDLSVHKERKASIEKSLSRLITKAENNRQQTFALDNELFIKRRNLKSSYYKTKNTKQEIEDLVLQYKELDLEYAQLSKELAIYQKEMLIVDEQIAQINLSYSRQTDEVRKMQITNAQSYYELKRTLDREISSSLADMLSKLKFNDFNDETLTIYEQTLKQKCEDYLDTTSEFIEDVYEILYKFQNNEKEAIAKSAAILDSGYQTDLIDLDKAAKIEAMDAKNIFLREKEEREDSLERFDKKVESEKEDLKQEHSRHEATIKKQTMEFQSHMDQANQSFYDDYYAICDNQKDIIRKQKEDLDKLKIDFDINREAILERFEKSKIQLNINLKAYIESRHEILDHLPLAVKSQETSIKEEAMKKTLEIEENYLTTSLKNSQVKKEIQKNQAINQNNFQNKQLEFEKEHKLNRQKEKKAHLYQMRHL